MIRHSMLVPAFVTVGVVGGALALKAGRPVEGPPPAAASAPVALPRFVDIGTTTCAPCRVMLGVMGELDERFAGQMVVEFLNTHDRPGDAAKLGITTIPTQIFYAPDGRELFRHVGVIRTEEIAAKWAELGFPLKPTAGG